MAVYVMRQIQNSRKSDCQTRDHKGLSTSNPMNMHVCIFMIMMIVVNSTAVASEIQDDNSQLYTRKGADTCLKCHDEDYKFPVSLIFFSKHGNRSDPRAPMAQLQCESCHGPGRAHATEPKVGQERAAIITFGKDSNTSTTDQNSMCMQCHKDTNRTTWQGSAHESEGMLCVTCHNIHVKKDPVLSAKQQVNTCYQCHMKQQAEFLRTSSHPVRYEKMSCSDCHNPHGSFSNSLLKTNSKNETCYGCHAEKRGPFLWAHAPVAEDCGVCHEHHGSIHDSLLKVRAPQLCQQCHSTAGHPSLAYDSSGLPSGTPNTFLLAKSCLNCHFQIHGSNHPSGVKLMR